MITEERPTTLLRSAIRIVERERKIIVESSRIRSQKVMRTYRDLDPSVRTTVRSMDRWLVAARRVVA